MWSFRDVALVDLTANYANTGRRQKYEQHWRDWRQKPGCWRALTAKLKANLYKMLPSVFLSSVPLPGEQSGSCSTSKLDRDMAQLRTPGRRCWLWGALLHFARTGSAHLAGNPSGLFGAWATTGALMWGRSPELLTVTCSSVIPGIQLPSSQKTMFWMEFLGFLWIKLVIKNRYLDRIEQDKIKWSCGHLKTWAMFNFT